VGRSAREGLQGAGAPVAIRRLHSGRWGWSGLREYDPDHTDRHRRPRAPHTAPHQRRGL